MLRSISRLPWLQIGVHAFALVPLLWLPDYYVNSINPIQDFTALTGIMALILLVLSLTCTPLNTLFGWRQVLPLRKPLGLYAFFYVSLHLLIFSVLDYGLDRELIQEAVTEKRYVLVGFSAFLLLLPLAITSTRWWMRRLKKRWKQLHRLVYLAAPLAVLHFLWLVKSDIREPLLYGVAVALLLLLRMPTVRSTIVRLRQRLTSNRQSHPACHPE